jgi:hypothetical protein
MELEKRYRMDKPDQDKPGPPPLVSPKTQEDPRSRTQTHHKADKMSNGYDRKNFADYERRLMSDRMFSQDRHIAERPNAHVQPRVDNTRYDHSRDKSIKQEGMQARLLENEKTGTFPRQQNHFDISRLPPHVRDSAYPLNLASDGRDSHHNKENHSVTQDSDVLLPYESHRSVVSRLDKEETRLRRARLNGEYTSDDELELDEDLDEEEERNWQRLLTIVEGPPMELDTSKNKLTYLMNIGLVSHRKKSGMF